MRKDLKLEVKVTNNYNFSGRERFIAILIPEIITINSTGFVSVKNKLGLRTEYIIYSKKFYCWNKVSNDMCLLTYGTEKSETLRKKIDKSVTEYIREPNPDRYVWLLLKKIPFVQRSLDWSASIPGKENL